jgi:hypothetical protein
MSNKLWICGGSDETEYAPPSFAFLLKDLSEGDEV